MKGSVYQKTSKRRSISQIAHVMSLRARYQLHTRRSSVLWLLVLLLASRRRDGARRRSSGSVRRRGSAIGAQRSVVIVVLLRHGLSLEDGEQQEAAAIEWDQLAKGRGRRKEMTMTMMRARRAVAVPAELIGFNGALNCCLVELIHAVSMSICRRTESPCWPGRRRPSLFVCLLRSPVGWIRTRFRLLGENEDEEKGDRLMNDLAAALVNLVSQQPVSSALFVLLWMIKHRQTR